MDTNLDTNICKTASVLSLLLITNRHDSNKKRQFIGL